MKGIADRRSRNEVVEALLRQVNLWDVRKQRLGGYSGGMRQRFGVAVALLGNPKLMIVDEPTAGLDPAERVRFLNLAQARMGRRRRELEAHKVVADSAGKEKEVPISEWLEIGIFAPAAPGEILGKPLYLQKHRIRSGTQTITMMLSERPARGGIDPYNLLDWEEGDNIAPVTIEGGRG